MHVAGVQVQKPEGGVLGTVDWQRVDVDKREAEIQRADNTPSLGARNRSPSAQGVEPGIANNNPNNPYDTT